VYTGSNLTSVINVVTPAGVVSTRAGQYNTQGYTDGSGTAAQFAGNMILGGVDAAGNLYISESSNIRRVTPGGVVSTLSGPATAVQGYMDGAGNVAEYSQFGLGVAPDGTSYVADYGNHVVRKVSPTGVATTLAGQNTQQGDVDGVGAAAQFLVPKYAAVDANGTMYVGDQNGMQIRKVTSNGTVTTLAGGTTNGWADGPGATALFWDIHAIAIGPSGSIYVLDQPSLANGANASTYKWDAIRQVSADGTVTTVAVSTDPGRFYATPAGSHVSFSESVQTLGSSPDGTLYVASQCAVGKFALP
jgi:hypothetical protein